MIRTLGFALAASHLLSQLPACEGLTIERRDGIIPTELPGTWTSQGCYVDVGRTLTGGGYDDNVDMTIESCISYCSIAGFIYAGTEYSSQCYCGNSLAAGSGSAPTGDCSMTCTGDSTEACGGPNRLNLFWSGTTGPQTNPGSDNWEFSGCYTEGITGRALPNGVTTTGGPAGMTVGLCLAACQTAGYALAGIEYGEECWCGNSIANGAVLSPSLTGCGMLCRGNHSEYCGGLSMLDIYDFDNSGTLPPTTTSPPIETGTATTSSPTEVQTLAIKPTVGAYVFQGCYTEGTGTRALSQAAFFDNTAMTLEKCATDCAAYNYFGVEYGSECYCGNYLGTGSVLATSTDCSMICPGNQFEYCGAGNRLELYMRIGSSVTSTGTTTTGTPPSETGFPTGWADEGCWVDGLNGRILNHQQPDNQALTQQSCVAACVAAGYTIAGVEYGVQCFCDNKIYNGGALAANQADCSMRCGGNSAQYCGAGSRMNVFSNGTPVVYQPPAPQTTGLPTNWVYKGCLQDNIPATEDPNQILPTFPYMVWNNASNTPEACITQCQIFGFNAAGLEYGSQCFCGDVQNILVASAPSTSTNPNDVQFYSRSAVPEIVPDSRCDAPCSGDPQYMCGSGNLMSYYAWDGPDPLYDFHFPTGVSAGEYTFLIGGVVVPLITAQGVNGKVTFTEKYGSGEPNGTGAYELDLSQIDNFSAAWRTMTGLETDVFCSAGLTLPDKAGRQVTVGGWAGMSNFGVRIYTPDGSPGVPGTNNWQEDSDLLSLQVPRWYPSAMVMANGSIMIVGGEIGSNDAQQPTLELLPATGVPQAGTVSGYSNTTVYLDFLERTAPFNLYPFVCVVPSGIFIAYYNEARILDEVTFDTVKTLPNMPGAVNDPTGGRTYQLEGSMVLLPQHAPYSENMGVLICGGSTEGGGYPIDNCISTRPEDAEPVWTIERMPSRRVMPCMAGLPDGTYVIVNGAQHGVGGFGLAGDPNYNAVLYDPSKPVNSRMSVMANTTVARLYHSEAITLLDGRVLVSGSDPTGDFNQPAGNWPEEYRVEVFSPPYLLSGLPRPTFAIANTDWEYGESVQFTVTSGSTANLRVSMLGSVVSTHGNAMGQRTIFPAFTCNGNTCTITAPPNAHVAPPGWFMLFVLDGPTPSVGQFVRIGKDPANIGDWPANLPAFAPLPGT